MGKIYIDDFDETLENDVERVRMIALPELHRLHPNETYNKIWYRVKTLAKIGRIGITRTRKNIVCYALDENEKGNHKRGNDQ